MRIPVSQAICRACKFDALFQFENLEVLSMDIHSWGIRNLCNSSGCLPRLTALHLAMSAFEDHCPLNLEEWDLGDRLQGCPAPCPFPQVREVALEGLSIVETAGVLIACGHKVEFMTIAFINKCPHRIVFTKLFKIFSCKTNSQT